MIQNFQIKIVDNFFSEKDYQELLQRKKIVVKENEIKVYHNSINTNLEVKSESISEDLILRIHKNYHEKVFKILEELSPEKAKLYEYTDLVLAETGANYSYPIHDDTPNKLLSGVIYIEPEKNSGTSFYKSRFGKSPEQVEWEKNRAVFFSRKEWTTWHAYSGNGISNRIVLIYNLNTTKIKEVYKIENKNFYLGKLRHGINPYLYRFFKNII
jgi:hypothetical protein